MPDNGNTKNTSGPPEKKKGLSTQAVILIIVLTLVISGTALAAVLLLRDTGGDEVLPTPTPEVGGSLVINEDNFESIKEQVQNTVQQGMFETYYTSNWVFPDGASPASTITMGNSPANTYPFYFTVTLDGETEPIYTSGVLPVGTTIKEVVLNRDLPAGSYASTVSIHMLDEDGEPIDSNASFSVTLDIES